MSSFKESLYTSYSGIKSSDVRTNFKQYAQYGLSHPLQFVALTSFVCFAVLPVLGFIGFALGTVFITLLAAVIWELFLIACAIVGLAVALCIALSMAGCCTGLATLAYFSLLALKSPFKWLQDGHPLHSARSKRSTDDDEDHTIIKDD